MNRQYEAIFGEYIRRVLPGDGSSALARELILFSSKDRESEARNKGFREDDMDPALSHEFDLNSDSAATMLATLAGSAIRDELSAAARRKSRGAASGSSKKSSEKGSGAKAKNRKTTDGLDVEGESQSASTPEKKEDDGFQVVDREREAKEYRESMKVGDVGVVGSVTEHGVATSEKKKDDKKGKASRRNAHDDLHEDTMNLDGPKKKDVHDKQHEDTMRIDDKDSGGIANEDPESKEEKESDMSLGGLANSFF